MILNLSPTYIMRRGPVVRRLFRSPAPYAHGRRAGGTAAGWELGTVGVTLTEEGQCDPLFADVPDTFPAQQSHGEIVAKLPPGARTLAHNP